MRLVGIAMFAVPAGIAVFIGLWCIIYQCLVDDEHLYDEEGKLGPDWKAHAKTALIFAYSITAVWLIA